MRSDPLKSRLHNLPVQPTPLLGREQELDAACALLQRPDVRLVTLVGPGGVGKTRLGMQIASQLLHDFTDGIFFVSLAAISDPELVASSIAQALGLREVMEMRDTQELRQGETQSLEYLKTYVADKHLLLLLDNFEQVAAAAPLLAELLAASTGLKMLVTSRAVLRIRGEHEFPVLPLPLPDLKRLPAIDSLSQYAAVALFTQCAQAVQPDFQVTDANARAIAEICTRLDGLPLAIELAAARIKLLPPQALLARLEHRLQVLTGGARDVPARQQTLWNTLKWSYDLLSVEEQQLFRRLSVFVGGFTLEAAETMCRMVADLAGGTALPVLDGVASLLDKSLLQRVEQQGLEARLRMLETIREFGLECLKASGEIGNTRHAHAAYYLSLAEAAEPNLTGAEEARWLERLEREYDNIRAALQWSVERSGAEDEERAEMALRLGGALWLYWWARGRPGEGRNFLEKALSGSEKVAAPVRAKALSGAAMLAFYQDDYDRAEVLCGESLALFRAIGNKQGIATSLNLLGQVASWRNNYAAARVLEEEALALFRESGYMWGIASSLGTLASVAIAQGEYARARSLAEEGLALFRAAGDKWGIAFTLHHLAHATFCQGDLATAHALEEESLTLSREVDDKGAIAYALGLLGRIVLYQGDAAAAHTLLEESLELHREVEDRWGIAQSLLFLARTTASQGDNTSARVLYEQSLAILGTIGDKQLIASCLEGLAEVAVAGAELGQAARLLGAAESLRIAIGALIPPVERADYERNVHGISIQLGDRAFKQAWAEGRAMTPEQVMTARGQEITPVEVSGRHISSTYSAGLTLREVDVLRLVAQGLTDAQVAERLVLSPRTVSTHLRSIYGKLGVTSRTAAARFAIDHRLV